MYDVAQWEGANARHAKLVFSNMVDVKLLKVEWTCTVFWTRLGIPRDLSLRSPGSPAIGSDDLEPLDLASPSSIPLLLH